MICDESENQLARKQHIRYLLRHLDILPSRLAYHDAARLTILFFALSGLDVLNALDELSEEKKKHIINWIYSLQVVPQETDDKESWKRCGFQGSSTLNFSRDSSDCSGPYVCGHLAMTYTGLAALIILGDNLSQVNKKAIIAGIKALQQEDGSFCATLSGSESDMRFVYCAACISYMLNDWSGMDVEKTISYILDSMSYDGAIGQGPDLESHGGTTFCAVAALALMGELDRKISPIQRSRLKKWLLMRQVTGFQGRPNKPDDTCYSFWVGASLKILGVFNMISYKPNRFYILSTQDRIVGGFSKWIDTTSDPMHTYLGLCGLSLMDEELLLPVEPRLNITQRAFATLKKIHEEW
ncbi:geranylgeranyl transferase type-1 subunit beta [Schistocerca nitens]|uniref:geranylgeranyl transferase type-1 subunit beta n=1 Tax=Schistocerca nitens TaxID=7011 RepID=UPI0021188245|nr:geranylgeranyl transferase type-1 subunit beta [Schistocerca nitens]